MKYTTQKKEEARAVLAALLEDSEEKTYASLAELERLLETSGGVAVAKVVQARDRPDPKTYLGSGKCIEIKDFIKNQPEEDKIDLVVFDNELSPSQIKNLEDLIECRVIDRTMLILDIFAGRATSAEGKLQVEIACLQYSAPRLMGKGTELSRLGGGIGTRGPGESQLETDRRHLKRRVLALKQKLAEVERQRGVTRSRRLKGSIKTAAIVGYTNAGKSTLLNYLTDAGILAEDKLFATLDPTTRRLRLPSGLDILLTDTVGFIDRLPHHLVEAFKSTLDEVKYADIIIHLCDASEAEETRAAKTEVTETLLGQLGAGAKPTVLVYNKCDACSTVPAVPDAVMISAKTGEGIDGLLWRLDEQARSLGGKPNDYQSSF